MKRYFTIEGADMVAYDDESEDWTINGAIEGNMSEELARMIMYGLRRDEITAEDAAGLELALPTGSVEK